MPLLAADLRREVIPRARKPTQLKVIVPAAVAETAKVLSVNDGVTLSKYIADLIRQDVRNRGGLMAAIP